MLLFAPRVFAHPGHDGDGFASGFLHPLLGYDHLLAMVAVGLLAVRWGGCAVWIAPVTFISCLALGGALAAWHVPLPGLEYGIVLSVLVLGLMIAGTNLVPLGFGAVLVGAFAIFHGYAHIAEIAPGESLVRYTAGFLLASVLLHAGGVLAGLTLARWADVRALRLTGGAIAAAGVWLLASVL
ncbi:MAG: HupE/UreJ family protein [Planctomycetes bacterium]|nr:HupE/UreJ family protein [Planctomycetota bacterium]